MPGKSHAPGEPGTVSLLTHAQAKLAGETMREVFYFDPGDTAGEKQYTLEAKQVMTEQINMLFLQHNWEPVQCTPPPPLSPAHPRVGSCGLSTDVERACHRAHRIY